MNISFPIESILCWISGSSKFLEAEPGPGLTFHRLLLQLIHATPIVTVPSRTNCHGLNKQEVRVCVLYNCRLRQTANNASGSEWTKQASILGPVLQVWKLNIVHPQVGKWIQINSMKWHLLIPPLSLAECNYSKYYCKIALSWVCPKMDAYRYRLFGWLIERAFFKCYRLFIKKYFLWSPSSDGIILLQPR